MRTGRLAASVAALALLATGCPSSHPRTQSSTTITPPAGTGTVVVAYPAEPATLDPFVAAGDTPATRDLARMLMPGLYKVTPSGVRARWLLASDPVESNGPPFSVTVALRDDAVWSDGKPITVDDLRFTWQLALRTQIARAGYDQISRIVAETPKRARIEFRSTFRRWRDLFSAGLGVMPAHAFSTPKQQASLTSSWSVSGGPFVLKAWHRGLDMIFEPNPHAWADRPLLQRLRVVFVPDDIGALALFSRGLVDVLGPYQAADWVRRAHAVPGATVTTDPGQTWMGIVLNGSSSPLNDVRVRQAFADTLDRARLVSGLLQDQGSKLDAVPPATNTPFSVYGDIDHARATLSTDGWKGSPVRSKGGTRLSFTIAVADSDGLAALIARAITYESARAGMDVQSITLPVDQLMSRWLPGARFQAAILEWRDPPEGAARARFASGGRLPNVARIADTTLNNDFLAEDGSAPAVSKEASQARLAAIVPVIPIANLTVTLVGSARVGGLVANAEADGPFWNVEQWFVR